MFAKYPVIKEYNRSRISRESFISDICWYNSLSLPEFVLLALSRIDDGPFSMQEIGFSEWQPQPHNESLSGRPWLTLSP